MREFRVAKSLFFDLPVEFAITKRVFQEMGGMIRFMDAS